MKYKELWEQMCQRCDELDKKLADQEQPPVGFITNARHRLNFEPNATGLKDMPKTIDWKIPVYASPQHREWVDLTGEELETLLSENRSLTLGAIWAVSNKCKEKNA